MTDAKHEAPAEGAGEALLPCPFCGGDAEIVHIEDGENEGGSCVCCTVCQASGNVEFERKENFISNWNRRARSSAPEAREEALGNLLAVIHGDGGHRALEVGTKQAALEAEQIVAGLFAAPSADKLRIAVEALELTKSRIQTWPIDDQETCMCGSPVAAHGMGDGHSPLSQGDHAVSVLVEEIDQALAALKAEGAA